MRTNYLMVVIIIIIEKQFLRHFIEYSTQYSTVHINNKIDVCKKFG